MQGEDPITRHEALIRSYLHMLQDLAEHLGAPIIFVGATPIDGHTVLMRSPKDDWADFGQFELAAIWDSVETAIFREGNYAPGVRHFRPSTLTDLCPGIRCDGLHYVSDFKENGCASTGGVSFPILARFLTSEFGKPTGGSIQDQ
jgi:hypothetical protein